MYFQQILQGIASDLMDSDLFQVRSSTFCKTYRWVLVTWGFLLRHFQPSVGLVFWEYQMSSFIWVIGHLATSGHTANMPKVKYMMLKMSLAEARVKAVFLCTQIFQKVCIISPPESQNILNELTQVLAYIGYKERLHKKLEKEGRQPPPQINQTQTAPNLKALFKYQNNQNLCLSFCHSLVSHPTGFFCTIYCIEFQFFFVSYSFPQTFTVYQTLALSLLAIFFGKFFTGLLLTIF